MPSDPALFFIVGQTYTVTLDRLTELVRAARIARTMGFLDKMKAAGQVAANLEAKAEAQADAIIARGADLETKLQAAVLVHTKRLDASYDALDGFEHALDVLGNGAPQAGSTASGAPSSGAAEPVKPPPPGVSTKAPNPYEPPYTSHGTAK